LHAHVRVHKRGRGAAQPVAKRLRRLAHVAGAPPLSADGLCTHDGCGWLRIQEETNTSKFRTHKREALGRENSSVLGSCT
jgi:hypothetical protein